MKLPSLVLLLACATAAAAAEPPPARAPVTAAGYAFKPDPADFYPEAARALGEQGMAQIRLCYDQRGKPVEITVSKSSGFTRLDEAALRYGKAVRIRPGTIGGQPQSDCVVVPVIFSASKSPQSSDQGENTPPPVQVPPILLDIPLPPPPPDIGPIPLAPSPPVRSIPL